MSSGFNSNVRVGEIVYHIQTELRGAADSSVADTVVYIAGRVIHRVKTNLRDGDATSDSSKEIGGEIAQRVDRQHQAVVAQVESGEFRAEAAAAVDFARAAKPPALTIRPIDPGSWLPRCTGLARDATNDPARASVTIELTLADGTPAAGAGIEVRLECDGAISTNASGVSDSTGKAKLELSMPSELPEALVVVVRASSGESRAEARFRMKARPAGSIPGSAA